MVLYKAVKPMFLINSKVECIFMSPMKYIYIYTIINPCFSLLKLNN